MPRTNFHIEEDLKIALQKREAANSLRTLSLPKGAIDFCSNDYLGMSGSSEVKEQMGINLKDKNLQLGSTGSRLISGNSLYHQETEQYLTKVFKSEKVLLFNSGYNANLGVLSAIPQRGDTIFYDELCHASIKDGMRLSLAQKAMFRHNNLQALETKLSTSKAKRIFVVVESVYSMDGDACPLVRLVDLCEKYAANLIIDEAHSTGVMGDNGGGMAVELGFENRIFARVYTFGKAIGLHGACVAGSKALIDYLINFSRSFIYTTALPAYDVVAIKSAFEVLNIHSEWQKELNSKIAYFKTSFERILGKAQLRTTSDSAIQGILISGNNKVKQVANHLNKRNFDVRPILSPTVKAEEERIRVCLHRFNSEKQIENLLTELKLATL